MRNKAIMLFAVTAAVTIIVDQLVKFWVVSSLAPGESFRLIGGIDIIHVKNSGAAFGLFSRSGWAIFIIDLVVVIIAVAWLFWSRTAREMGIIVFVGIGLMVGGALGNMIDRVFRGTVVDFVDFHWWPVFNVADLAIVAGVIIVVIAVLMSMRSGTDGEAERE